ncbi:MAG: MFS transporter [Sphingobacteriales bacterium]|nr:MAG: MFS transporter [Sphingobacteriales bacterium]
MRKIAALYKEAYTGLSPSTWLLSLVMLINRAGTMVVPFMTLYLTQRGYSISSAGMVMALFGCGAICGGIIGGKLTDKIGFYRVQLFALAGGGLIFFLLGQVTSLPMICATAFLSSLVNESFRPANAAAIVQYSKEENRTRSYSLNRLAINVGWACGGALGGFIASHNYQLLFWIDGCTNISAAVMLWLFLRPSKNQVDLHKTKIAKAHTTGNSAYRDKPYLVFVVLTMLFAYCFFQSFSTLPVFYKQQLKYTESYIGMVMAINGILITLFEMIIVHQLERKKRTLTYIPIGVMLIGLSFVTFNILPLWFPLAIVWVLFVTAGEIFSMPFLNSFWISRTSPENRGQYAGLYTVAWSVAQVLGPATGAQIAEHYGFEVLWWFVGFICTVAISGFIWLNRKVNSATA